MRSGWLRPESGGGEKARTPSRLYPAMPIAATGGIARSLREALMVDDATVPFFVDAAGLSVEEMDMHCEAGDDNTANGEKERMKRTVDLQPTASVYRPAAPTLAHVHAAVRGRGR